MIAEPTAPDLSWIGKVAVRKFSHCCARMQSNICDGRHRQNDC
jgi:hypothetical protein